MFLTLPENRRSCRTGFYHAVTVLGSTILAIACAPTTRTSLAPVAGLLSPGARDLATAHFRDASVKFHFTQLAPNEATPRRGPGDGQVETRVTSYKGVPALLFIRSFVGRGAPFLDTALVLRDGLVPVWEIHHQGTRRTRFDYSGSHVTVEVTAPDSVRRRVEHLYTVPSFHFNELDELISSIPLHSGYHAIVPLYSEGDGALEMDTVEVEGQDSTGTWNVRFADKVIIGHYGIDAATRTILRHDAERHTGGVRVRYVEDR